MARKKRRSGGGGAKSFCPVIHIKCARRKFSKASSESSVHRAVKYASYKQGIVAAKRKLRKAMGLGNIHPQAEATSLPAAAVQKVAHAAANPATSCTVRMGGRSWRLKGAAVGTKVAELIRSQKSGGCCHPKVSRG